ncbi:MAG: hypothetical protein R3E31_06580 [Chloroflexota bacterium]
MAMVELEKALGYEFVPQPFSYTERDAALYALSVGAAGDPLDGQALRYVYELHGQGFRVLPTFAVTFPFAVMPQILSVPGLPAQPMMILHGEHYLALKRPLPVSATLTQQARISQIYDKRQRGAGPCWMFAVMTGMGKKWPSTRQACLCAGWVVLVANRARRATSICRLTARRTLSLAPKRSSIRRFSSHHGQRCQSAAC